MNHITLRPATPNDSEFAYQTKRSAFKGYIEEAIGWDEAYQRERHETRFTGQNFRIIQKAGRDIGVLAVVEEKDRLKLNQIFIQPEHHGQGIGTDVMNLVLEEAKARRLPVELRVLHSNPRAISFYRRLGFKETDSSRTHLHMRCEFTTE